jgi:hypothetical protein
MNVLFFTLLLSTINGGADLRETEKGILLVPFHQVSEEKDKTLERNQAVYRFHVDAQYNTKEILNSVWLKVDNCEKVKTNLDSLGNCSYTMVPGKHDFEFYANKCQIVKGHCDTKPQTRNEFNVRMTDSTIVVVVCKPVIYLYPAEETPVQIKLDVKGKLGFTWPIYGDEWTVLAYPNGKIQDEGTMYNYLFWDGKMQANKLNYNQAKGSVVQKSKLVDFLSTALNKLGFTSSEEQDFLTYWVPKMMENEFNYVHFLINDDYEQIAGVNVNPKPDNMLRVYMIWHGTKDEKSVNCTSQEFKSIKRDGFTYVEWGGSEMPVEKQP